MVKNAIHLVPLFTVLFLMSCSAIAQIDLNIPKEYDTLFFESGEIKILRQLNGNVVDGEFIEYYGDGSIKFHAKYKNGVLNGFANAWYEEPNKVAYKGRFSYGHEMEIEYFLPNGDKISREKFLQYMDSKELDSRSPKRRPD